MNSVRLTATGNPNGPSLYHLLEVIGKDGSLVRIERALGQSDLVADRIRTEGRIADMKPMESI